jgi:phage shock protein PspC (stress-responsive transcriptional regulator)
MKLIAGVFGIAIVLIVIWIVLWMVATREKQ